MKYEFKDVAELVGIAAIVASLIFVGLQMKQSQALADAENRLSYSSNRVDLINAINEHVDVWVKGNAGESLTTPEEEAIYTNLVSTYISTFFFNFAQQRDIRGTSADESNPVANVVAFLYENPGAYAVWDEEQLRAQTYRRAVLPDSANTDIGDDFRRAVREGVERLKELELD